MGISVSYQPNYPGREDFVRIVQNANQLINNDTVAQLIWTQDERQSLLSFFNCLKSCLYNINDSNSVTSVNPQLPWFNAQTPNGGPGKDWAEDEGFKEYFTKVRLSIPKSMETGKIFSYADDPTKNHITGSINGFNEDFSNATPQTQIQICHFYALMGFLWAMYDDGINAAKYFYKSDILHYICQIKVDNKCTTINYQKVDNLISAIRKIYFTGGSTTIPANSLVLPTCAFRLVNGSMKSTQGQTVRPNSTISKCEPFITITPVHIRVARDEIPNRSFDDGDFKFGPNKPLSYHLNPDAIDIEEDTPKFKHFNRSKGIEDENNVQYIQTGIHSLVDKLRQVTDKNEEKCGRCLRQGIAGNNLVFSYDDLYSPCDEECERPIHHKKEGEEYERPIHHRKEDKEYERPIHHRKEDKECERPIHHRKEETKVRWGDQECEEVIHHRKGQESKVKYDRKAHRKVCEDISNKFDEDIDIPKQQKFFKSNLKAKEDIESLKCQKYQRTVYEYLQQILNKVNLLCQIYGINH